MSGENDGTDAIGEGSDGDACTTNDASATDDAIPPEQAFAVLGDETRLAILRALAEERGQTLGFNELRKRVGAKDSSGFNYHLGKLVGRFVRKGEEGYELTTAGSQVYGAILSGAYTDRVDLDPIPLTDEDDVCPDCGQALEAAYEDERMEIRCRDCDRIVAGAAFPPAAVEGRPPASVPTAFGGYLTTMVELARNEICSVCSGRMTGRIVVEAVPEFEIDGETPLAIYECERCFNTLRASPGSFAVTHPAVVSFYDDRGVDVRDVPPWRLRMLRDEAMTVTSEDPLRVAVEVRYAGDELVLTLDEALEVVDVDGPRPLE